MSCVAAPFLLSYSIPMTPHTTVSRALACLAFAALLPGRLPAQRDLASAFPADTWALVTCAGLDASTQAFAAAKVVGVAKTALGEEGRKTLDALVRQQGGRDLAEAMGFLSRLGLDNGQVRQLLAGPFAFGVGRPTMSQNVLPSLALVAAIGDNKAAREAIASLEQFVTEKVPHPLAKSSTTVAGVSFTTLQLPHGAGPVLHGVHDGHWFLSNSAGFIADCLNALRGQAPSLAKNPSLAASRGRLPGQRLGEVFINAQQFGAALQPFLPYEAEGLGRALGVTGMPNLFAACAHDGKGAHDVLELALPGPVSGLFKAPFSKPLSNRAAQWLKPQTAVFASFSLDCAAATKAAEQFIAALPAPIAKELQQGFDHDVAREMQHELGMTPAELLQLCASVGPEVSVAFDIPMTFTVFVEARDPARAERMLVELASSGRVGHVQTEEVNGGKTWSVDMQMDGPRMSPTVGLRDGWLVASNFKNVVKRHMQAQPLGGKALAADPRFQAAAKSAEGSALFVTGRLQPMLDGYWGLAATVMKAGANAAGFEPESVPDAEEMAAALDDVVITGSVTENGFALKVQQPLGVGTLLPAAASALDWLLGAKPVARAEAKPGVGASPKPASKPVAQKIY